MGRKGKCFGAVKKVFSPESKEKKNKKDKKWGLGRNKDSDPSSSESLESACLDPAPPRLLPTNPQPHPEEFKLAASENEQSKHADSVAVATESAVASAQAATGVACRTAPPRFAGKSDEEIAAIRIQTAFRGYLGKNSSGSENPMFMDPNNPHWGWSWMAARPWECRSTTNKDLNGDRASVKSASVSVNDGEIAKAYALRDSILDKTSLATQSSKIRPSSLRSPSTPRPKPPVAGARVKSASPRTGRAPGDGNDDARSMLSTNSERPNRRHSIAGSSVGDDGESLASSPAVPSYMAPTQSARARSRFHSPSGDSIEGLDKVPAGSVKKRLSFPMSPAAGARRHSGPPKVDLATVMDVAVQ